MPQRALIERRPWLLASLALAVAFIALQWSAVPGVYLLVLQIAPLLMLSVYALLRHRGRDTRLLAIMLALEGLGWTLSDVIPVIGINLLMFGLLAGLSLFLTHRIAALDVDRRIAAAVLLLGTPVLCLVAVGGAGAGALFFGLALGGMAGSAWISTFPRQRVGAGAVLIILGTVLSLAAADNGSAIAETAEWALFYLGNLVLATGVTGELRLRENLR